MPAILNTKPAVKEKAPPFPPESHSHVQAIEQSPKKCKREASDTLKQPVKEPDSELHLSATDTFSRYYYSLSKIPLLSPEEEYAYACQIIEGNTFAKQRMIECNLRLVVKVAYLHQHRGLPLMDLIEEGNIGLMRAVEKFNPYLGNRFSTYAMYWIRQAIDIAILNQVRLVRWPVYKSRWLKAQLAVNAQEAQQRNQQFLSGKQEDDISFLNKAVSNEESRKLASLIQWSVSCDDDESPNAQLQKQMAETTVTNPAVQYEQENEFAYLHQCVSSLPAKHQYVLIKRFGLDGELPQTLADIAQVLGLSRERIRQIQSEGIASLQRYFI